MFGIRRRHLVVHPAHRTVGVSLPPIASQSPFQPDDWMPGWSGEETLRVCLVAGSSDPVSDHSAEVLARYLERAGDGLRNQTCCQILKDWESPGDFNDCHCVVVFLDGRLPDAWLAAVARFGRHGGVVGLRAADAELLQSPAKVCDLFGAECRGRIAGPGRPEIQVAPGASHHPIVAGVRPFTAGASLARTRLLAADAVSLLVGELLGVSETVAWVRDRQEGRGFCTTLGHSADFCQPSFLRLLANAVLWTSRHVVER